MNRFARFFKWITGQKLTEADYVSGDCQSELARAYATARKLVKERKGKDVPLRELSCRLVRSSKMQYEKWDFWVESLGRYVEGYYLRGTVSIGASTVNPIGDHNRDGFVHEALHAVLEQIGIGNHDPAFDDVQGWAYGRKFEG